MKSFPAWCLALLLSIAAAVHAAPRARAADLVEPAKIDALVQPLIDGQWIYGVTIGLINEHGTQTAGYGRVSESNDAVPGADTLFEIGSISKVFTGLILAKMVEDGTVTLADPVQSLLGDSITVPKGEREITLVDLSTHSSGLPRMPTNFAPKDPANPYADYTVEQMAQFLAAHKLRRQPGEKYEYSNLAVGLLGHALARKSGMPYEELLTKTICQPLALANTVITLDDAHRARLAAGHDGDGQPVANWDLPTLAGAGAIRSTSADMLTFLSANLGLSPSPLAAAMRLSHQVQFKNPDGAPEVALGWHVNRNGKLLWHNGATAGYHAYAAFRPETKTGVVVLGSSAVGHVDALGLALVKLLETGEAKPLKLPKTIDLTAEELEPLVGSYKLAAFSTAKVNRENNRLFVQLTGQPRIGLYPTSKTNFFCRPVEASFDFETGDDGKIARMVIHQNGMDIPAQRTP
jgi:serine-type D-Ala-D-Ala carboxypeptidase/endopeptidase